MLGLEALKSVRFVVGRDGRPAAVQLDMETWEALLDYLEDTEDRETVKSMVAKLRAGPQKSKAVHWSDVQAEWEN
ncbi:hypothetical protein TFLX_00742 [Thermoflexales bacterium]|jgi:hypothetical protein|nr:hypothetical protein TFLX_00742 [Thermoflexales bacterium]